MNTYSKIINSDCFRRLKGKTQLFSPDSNDHYRNRLTHTVEVYSVALEIKSFLRLNVDDELLAAIAFSHDLGHTPFGHVGERTLHSILCGEDDLGGLLFPLKTHSELLQGFKHNIYSAKVYLRNIDYKEDKKFHSAVIDGILKHTDLIYKNSDFSIDYSLNSIIRTFGNLSDENYVLQTNPYTIEGKIVAMADEIAQRCSDFQDALLSKVVNFNDIKEALLQKFFDKEKLSDVSISTQSIHDFLINCVVMSDENVHFDENGKKFNSELSEFIKNKIQGSYLIRSDDSKNSHIIRQVFKAYFKNPQQLDDTTLHKIYMDIYRSGVGIVRKMCSEENSDNIIDNKKMIKFLITAIKSVENNDLSNDNSTIYMVFLKNIAYYIANMTDRFLLKKYNKLYNGLEE